VVDFLLKPDFQIFVNIAMMRRGFVRGTRLVDGTTLAAQVLAMASSTQTASSSDWTDRLPSVTLEVRQGSARPVHYTLGDVDFLIGGVTGCDLRLPGEVPAVLCLFARHPAGVTFRKLAPTASILVNGHPANQRDLSNGDRVQLGAFEIHVHIQPAVSASPTGAADLEAAKQEFKGQVQQFRQQVVAFQQEKDTFDRQRQAAQVDTKNVTATGQAAEIEQQRQELARTKQELADVRQQLYEHYQDRRDRLAAQQEELEKLKHELDERERRLRLEEEDAADSRRRDRKRHEELDQRSRELAERIAHFDAEARRFEDQRNELVADWNIKHADLAEREQICGDRQRDADVKLKQYETDVVRLHRQEADLERRETLLRAQTEEQNARHEQLRRDTLELEDQLIHLDQWRVRLTEESDRLAMLKQDLEAIARQQTERSTSLEGQQATFAVLRSRLERMRDDIRAREQELDHQRERQDARELEIARKQKELDERQRAMDLDRQQYESDRQEWLERSAVLESAVHQLKQAQENLSAEEARLRGEAELLDEMGRKAADADGVLQGRLAQLAEAQEHLDRERKLLQDRSVALVEREQACVALQGHLQRRSEAMAAMQQELNEKMQSFQARLAEFETMKRDLEERAQALAQRIEAWGRDAAASEAVIKQKHADVVAFEEKHQSELNQLVVQRKAHADERAQFHLEQRLALETLAKAKAELDQLRKDSQAFLHHLPDAELQAGAVIDRLAHARQQLRDHLGEIHQYVRQCQEELEQMRGRLQQDLDQLHAREQGLRRSQDEHRLAMAAFRQQLIDWQAQIADHKRTMERGQTRLDRQQAEVDERAKEVDAKSVELAQQADFLNEQEREVGERREEVDRHLVEMRQWYRRKLRELAGIPLMPDSLSFDNEPAAPPDAAKPSDADDAITPTDRNILSITGAVEPGDKKLGDLLRVSQLMDTETLTALLAEARRQRRSLRQVLLASGVITLYQLALIEAGNIDGLMLGPVRIVDRLRVTTHETVYRVFDPRRGVEAVLRHLAEADMGDAVKPDEFRQRFGETMLNDPHLANTLEVLELAGRPAVMQEWLSGLPATDWPPLAAAPGVCYRLLTQAAQGLAIAHPGGVVHGHLCDALLVLTGDGVLKICGLGEPPWLVGLQYDDEPTPRDDLRTLGTIVSGWCTPTGVRKGPKTKPLPEALVSILYRLAADGDPGYRDAKELLADLQKAAPLIPPNAEAWERLLRYVREHGTPNALIRQSA